MGRNSLSLKQRRAPLVEALLDYAERSPSSFHVPGHKRGASFSQDPNVASWLGNIGLYDATELSGLDDLHNPQGAILAAQQLAAQCFGAERTFFLVGGSTVGNLAMISAVCKPGEIILMQRNAHKSALHALMLTQAGAVFLPPEQDHESGLYLSPSTAVIDEQLRKFPDAKAVFITNPNYFGMSADLCAIAETVHKHGKPLLVDEAHGAHFGLDPELPESALHSGADVVVQSTHKMLPAMTMGAMLHVQHSRVDPQAIERRLGMLQSSSPSYPIMASLDWARVIVHANPRERQTAFRSGLGIVRHFKDKLLKELPRFRILQHAMTSVYHSLDPFKVTVYDGQEQISGFKLQAELYERGCDAEMSDERHVLLVFGMESSVADAERLLQALREIDRSNSPTKQEKRLKKANNIPLWSSSPSQPVFFDMDGVRMQPNLRGEPIAVPIEHAAGMLSAEMVIPYPPGIPLLFPGERITSESIEALVRYRSDGAAVQGISDKMLRSILVWAGNGI